MNPWRLVPVWDRSPDLDWIHRMRVAQIAGLRPHVPWWTRLAGAVCGVVACGLLLLLLAGLWLCAKTGLMEER